MTAIRAKLGPAFVAMETITRSADDLFLRNESKAFLDRRRYATAAAAGLYAKARKNVEAVHLLALNGFGEDAMILARSLVNMCIDLRFICGDAAESEVRARRWIARGRVGRRTFGKRVGAEPPDETRIDWEAETRLSEEWDQVKIWGRAESAKLEDFYNLPYRHGSTFEHSDSWSALSFVELEAGEARLLTVPSERFVDLALLTSCCSLAEIAETFGKYFDFDMGAATDEMMGAIKKGFPVDAKHIDEEKAK